MPKSPTLQAHEPARGLGIAGHEQMAASNSPLTHDPAWLASRKAKPTEILLPRTARWMAALPLEFQPTATAELFPRIANAIAALSTEPEELTRYLDDLLGNKRRHRQGFPPRVMSELHALSAYHATVLASQEPTASQRRFERHTF